MSVGTLPAFSPTVQMAVSMVRWSLAGNQRLIRTFHELAEQRLRIDLADPRHDIAELTRTSPSPSPCRWHPSTDPDWHQRQWLSSLTAAHERPAARWVETVRALIHESALLIYTSPEMYRDQLERAEAEAAKGFHTVWDHLQPAPTGFVNDAFRDRLLRMSARIRAKQPTPHIRLCERDECTEAQTDEELLQLCFLHLVNAFKYEAEHGRECLYAGVDDLLAEAATDQTLFHTIDVEDQQEGAEEWKEDNASSLFIPPSSVPSSPSASPIIARPSHLQSSSSLLLPHPPAANGAPPSSLAYPPFTRRLHLPLNPTAAPEPTPAPMSAASFTCTPRSALTTATAKHWGLEVEYSQLSSTGGWQEPCYEEVERWHAQDVHRVRWRRGTVALVAFLLLVVSAFGFALTAYLTWDAVTDKSNRTALGCIIALALALGLVAFVQVGATWRRVSVLIRRSEGLSQELYAQYCVARTRELAPVLNAWRVLRDFLQEKRAPDESSSGWLLDAKLHQCAESVRQLRKRLSRFTHNNVHLVGPAVHPFDHDAVLIDWWRKMGEDVVDVDRFSTSWPWALIEQPPSIPPNLPLRDWTEYRDTLRHRSYFVTHLSERHPPRLVSFVRPTGFPNVDNQQSPEPLQRAHSDVIHQESHPHPQATSSSSSSSPSAHLTTSHVHSRSMMELSNAPAGAASTSLSSASVSSSPLPLLPMVAPAVSSLLMHVASDAALSLVVASAVGQVVNSSFSSFSPSPSSPSHS